MTASQGKFSMAAWTRNAVLVETIRNMPFNRELLEGSLGIAQFQHYIVQDAHYLVAFGQALAIAAAKADHPDHIVQFANSAATALLVERELHADYFRRFGIEGDFAVTTPSPVCHHYTSFLMATALREPLPVLLAALLPCFWVYAEVGRHIHAQAKPDNPYRAWIDTYAGEPFQAAVRDMIGTTDLVAEKQSSSTTQVMHAAFTRATQLEWMFWNSAYRLERWPV